MMVFGYICVFLCDAVIKLWSLQDGELAVVVGQQSIAADGCDDPDGEFNPVPLCVCLILI
jgi:hypothetical protein